MNAKVEGRLKGRPREVAMLLAQGMGYSEAGRQLGLHNSTVRGHASRAFEILGVKDIHELRALLASKGPVLTLDEFDNHRSLRRLTHREREVVLLYEQGYSASDIGKKLFLSAQTIRVHASRIYMKLGVSSRKELTKVLRGGQTAQDLTAKSLDEIARYLAVAKMADSVGASRANEILESRWDLDESWDLREAYLKEARSLMRFLGVAPRDE